MKKPQDKEFLFVAKIDSITFKLLKDLTEKEALNDGFSSLDECIKGLLEINRSKTINNFCYIVKFTPMWDLPFIRRKSIPFRYFKEKLGKEKCQTIRMLMLPNYIIGELVNIFWKPEILEIPKITLENFF